MMKTVIYLLGIGEYKILEFIICRIIVFYTPQF